MTDLAILSRKLSFQEKAALDTLNILGFHSFYLLTVYLIWVREADASMPRRLFHGDSCCEIGFTVSLTYSSKWTFARLFIVINFLGMCV